MIRKSLPRVIRLFLWSTVFWSTSAIGQIPQISSNKCERRINPEGIDVTTPRLSWIIASGLRGDRQIAYQVIVASDLSALKNNKGDLWDSGRQASADNYAVYHGKRLSSGKQCYWKVRVWNSQNKQSSWSPSAHWSIGLLSKADWKGKWITAPLLADPQNFPGTPVNCYRSQTTSDQNENKWVVLDLGSEQLIDEVNVIPARSANQNMDFSSVMYPLRYKMEVSVDSDFHQFTTVADYTSKDVFNPRQANNNISFAEVKTRYIRLWVTKLGKWDVNLYGLALGGFKAYWHKKAIEGNLHVKCSDAIENDHWSKKFLLQNENQITNAPDAKALMVNVKELSDVRRENQVSRVPSLRREFQISKNVRRVMLYVTARGFYEFHINGEKVGNDFLVPGVSDFNKRIAYQTYDVTHMLKQGKNAIGAQIGYGWYAGHMNLSENRNIYGHYPMLLAQLEIELVNGKRITIATDKSWKSTLNGEVLWSDLLDGEAVDQRQAMPGWDRGNFDDSNWTDVQAQPLDDTKLVWQRSQPVKEIRELKPAAIKRIANGIYVFDFGQEIAGWCRLHVQGKKGEHIRVRHAELLKENGDIDMSNLWGTLQQEDYIIDGNAQQVLAPHFTYHGFRYVQVTGLANEPDAGTITAVSLHDNVPDASNFLSSNKLYNKLMETAKWTQRNLLFDVPNGCAARSERLGWTGDLRPCVQSLIYNMDVSAFLEKYAQDMRDDQTSEGQFTDIAPQAHLYNTPICVGSPGWADAGVSMPWQIYVNYGDKHILEEHYTAARRWVDFVSAKNPNFIWENNRGMDWGDWLSAGPPTPRIIGSTAFFAHDADQLAKMANVLGKKQDELKYRQLFLHIKDAFTRRFANEDGYISEVPNGADVQGSYALALDFNLLDEPLRSKAVSRLAQLIKENNNHLTTGFWSSIEMLLALSREGNHTSAANVVNNESQPSWGYMLKAGGTTFWESFDANTKNLSLNHWTYSSIGEWLWRYVAGLNADENNPGYKHFTINPHPGTDVNFCKATFESVRGPIQINWKLDSGAFTMDVTIPPGSTATVHIPSGDIRNLTESGTPVRFARGVTVSKRANKQIVLDVGSGSYHFVCELTGSF